MHARLLAFFTEERQQRLAALHAPRVVAGDAHALVHEVQALRASVGISGTCVVSTRQNGNSLGTTTNIAAHGMRGARQLPGQAGGRSQGAGCLVRERTRRAHCSPPAAVVQPPPAPSMVQ